MHQKEASKQQAAAAATTMAGDEDATYETPIDIVVPDRNYGFPREAFDPSLLPDFDNDFLSKEDLEAFISALAAPEPTQNPEDSSTIRLGSPVAFRDSTSFDVTRRASSMVLNDGPRPRLRHSSNKNGNQNEGEEVDEAQEVAAHAAAAAADVSASSQPNGLDHAHRDSSSAGQQHPLKRDSFFITAQNDWAPVHQKIVRTGTGGTSGKKRRHKRPRAVRPGRRTKDETREGYLYGLLKWPFLVFVGGWLLGLSAAYVLTRYYIWFYEYFISWRGRREQLRRNMRATGNYRDWRAAARELDDFLGNTAWKETNEFAYYDWKTVRRVWESMKKSREAAEAVERKLASDGTNVDNEERQEGEKAVEALRALLAACVKNNFVGVENPRLYSQTYYGTKNLVQNHVDEGWFHFSLFLIFAGKMLVFYLRLLTVKIVEKSLKFILETKQMHVDEKRELFKSLHANYGRTALCLSGGATFAYYHFGVIKALLEEDLLPDVITGTSGGALVAGLVATRTNEELKQLLVPALAHRITACSDPFLNWVRRWYRTGARFDSVDWAKKCSWFTHGSMTFREAYERTGRILNVSCVPADPHSPTMLCNYLTSPDCVVWSAVLASAAVPGILNPVVLMMKQRDGTLVPYSFGHKWKDGSLRTDIPLKALNLHFNVNFTIVSQVNPHINLFFFSSRGSVGQPVTHRKGRGWRGGFLGTAAEQYIKLDMTKWLKILRQLELLPRLLGQDWSQIWLQQGFGGTITIWPRSIPLDFVHILTDPTPPRLARMIHEGQQSAFPTIKFVANRLKIERLVERGRRETRGVDINTSGRPSTEDIIDEEDWRNLLRGEARRRRLQDGSGEEGGFLGSSVTGTDYDDEEEEEDGDISTADEAELEEDSRYDESAIVDVEDVDDFATPGELAGRELGALTSSGDKSNKDKNGLNGSHDAETVLESIEGKDEE